jgi:single-strand DNA-binding protein
MNTFNEVTGIFCLGRDPEVRYTPSGVAVASFSGASNYSYFDKKADEWVQETEWTNFTAWAKQAERIGERLQKGSLVYIAGRLKTDQWEDKDGNTRYTTKVIIRKIEFLANYVKAEGGYPRDDDVPGDVRSRQESSAKSSVGDDDIPF